MAERPDVSIIVAAFNAEQHIGRAIMKAYHQLKRGVWLTPSIALTRPLDLINLPASSRNLQLCGIR
jgi:hypothetical protein